MGDSESDVIIRPATRDDMPRVFELIKALAKFEKMENDVLTNADILIKDGFECNPPAFTCFVAETKEHRVVGFSLYYISYLTWLGKAIFLEDLYVDEAFRKLGIGKKLFLAVARVAFDTKQLLYFHVLSWNPAAEFYRKFGAVNLTELQSLETFRLDKFALERLLNC